MAIGSTLHERKGHRDMKAGKFDISVIICSYAEDRWNDLIAAVESVQRQSISPCEIIVVIDHNTSLYQRVQAALPRIIVLENSQSRGISGARNSGIAVAKGNLLAFIDDDAVAQVDWLQRLSACCQDTQVLGAGGFVEACWPNECPQWFPREFYWVVGCSYQDIPEMPISVRNPFLGCSCIKKEVFEDIGGFKNEVGRVGALPLGCEETELCIRALQRWPQKIFLFEPQARISHHIAAYRTGWHYFCSRCYFEGISKATIARYVGAQDSLSSERTYMLNALPRGVLRGLRETLFRCDVTGLMRAGTIIAGLIMTVTGYLVGNATLCFFSPKERR
jgi:GT2 family glycosyltransferase